MFQQKGWQGKERKETQPEQSQGSRHFAVFCLHLKFTGKGLHVQGQPCSPMVPPEQTLEVRCRWFAVLWWVLVGSQLFWGFSFSSSSPLLSLPFGGEAPACQDPTHAKCLCWWVSVAAKGLHEALRAPYRFGTSKCRGEDHGGWQENTPIKRGRELPVCLWCICAFLPSLVRRLNLRSLHYSWMPFHTYCKKNLL